jgi:hypothetical protein
VEAITGGIRSPGLDPAIDEALQEFIAHRKASMPDQHYF